MRRLLLILLIILIQLTQASASNILNYSDIILHPFFSEAPETGKTDWEALRHKGDPLAVTTALFNRLRQARTSPIAKEDASAALEMFLNRWPNTTREGRTFRWNYNQPYNQIAPGWWSGMDVFLSVVVLIAADEVYE